MIWSFSCRCGGKSRSSEKNRSTFHPTKAMKPSAVESKTPCMISRTSCVPVCRKMAASRLSQYDCHGDACARETLDVEPVLHSAGCGERAPGVRRQVDCLLQRHPGCPAVKALFQVCRAYG